MSNVFANYSTEQRNQAESMGLSLTGCDGMSALWFKPCCKRFTCLENGAPYGSPRCVKARDEGRCRYNPTQRGQHE